MTTETLEHMQYISVQIWDMCEVTFGYVLLLRFLSCEKFINTSWALIYKWCFAVQARQSYLMNITVQEDIHFLPRLKYRVYVSVDLLKKSFGKSVLQWFPWAFARENYCCNPMSEEGKLTSKDLTSALTSCLSWRLRCCYASASLEYA